MNITIPSGFVTALEGVAVAVAVAVLNAAQTAVTTAYPQFGPFVVPVIAALVTYLDSLTGNPVAKCYKAVKCSVTRQEGN